MKSILVLSLASSLAVVCAGVGLAGQSGSTERKEKSTVEVKGGKEIAVTGCLERSSGDTRYVLINNVGGLRYAVVTNDDLTKYVDHRVEVKGHAADRGNATVKVERKAEGTSGTTAKLKTERKGDTTPVPYFGLESIKSIASSCD